LTVCLAPAVLVAQGPPLGPEFRVSTQTARQGAPSIASRGDGSFVVVWSSQSEETQYGRSVLQTHIFEQRFDSSGAKAGPQHRVDTRGTPLRDPDKGRPALAVSKTGDFVVVWGDWGGYGGAIFGQRFNSSGGRLGENFQINKHTTWIFTSSVAIDGTGNFAVFWVLGGGSVLGQRYNSSGAKVGDAFRVSPDTTAFDFSVAMSGTGDFVVVWGGVFGQRFNRSGALVGAQFQANTDTAGLQTSPSVAMSEHGNFVVVWQGPDGSDYGVFGQRFDSSGAKIGSEFLVNSYTTGSQRSPAVTVSKSGDFVVVWESDAQDGPGSGVFGQRFDVTGAKVGTEFEVNAPGAGARTSPRVVDDGRGLAFVWVGSEGLEISGRRQNLYPRALSVDSHSGSGTASDLNRVMEPGENALIETTWSNVGAHSIANLTGEASSFSGPEGLYSLSHTSASYGAMPPGSLRECNDGNPDDCYAVTIGGQPRPATHWDADLEETLSGGGSQHWRLHLGDSFTDVPRTQPFYAKIETALHNGITAGCTATQYCPGDPLLRGQIAIFIAKALAGSGENVPVAGTQYDCSPGGASLFTDVAPTDIFCKHVHYLASRNVIPGCGGSQFCSGQAVTREAMASFIAKAIVAPGGAGAVPSDYKDPVTTLSYSCDPASPNLHFTDVPVSSPFCRPIHYLWAKGVISGCSATEFCPSDAVNRGAMAKFIANGFGLKLYKP
jgi:hypothetical protein